MKKQLIVVGGPTASGKTALSIALAQHFQTEIISADSRQCYRELTIGTAKPDQEELAAAPHHFIDSHSISETFNAGAFAAAASTLLTELFSQHNVVILTGGSGLYIKALTDGIDELPDTDPALRKTLNELFREKGIAALQEELQHADPQYFATVDRNNHRRLIRALEIIRSSGKPYSSFLGISKPARDYSVRNYAIDYPRDELYARIDARVDRMVAQGLVEEVKGLLPYRSHPALRTVGYQELFAYFDEQCTLEEAIALIKQHSRNYAKRQVTWFRNQSDFTLLPPSTILQQIIAEPDS